MRSTTLRFLIPAFAALLIAGVGCASKKALFSPTPPPPPQPEATNGSGSSADKPQAIGTEGFGEKSLTGAENNGAAGAAGAEGAAAGDLAAQIAASLKTIYFEYDSDQLSGPAMATLTTNAQWLAAHPKVKVTVEGHCDERGTIEYNLALGQRRARSVRDQLVRLGVKTGQLDLISYGKERPAEQGHDESAWSKNRRAEFQPVKP